MGSKRGRLLIRQQRIKKDGEPMVTGDLETPDAAIYQEYLLSVPSQAKIERHASEPSPHTSSIITQQLSGQSLLTVPSTHSYLIKQHSNPLLPSQSHASPGTSYQLHRQLSHPVQTTSSVTTSMHHAQEIAASGQLLQLHKQRSHPTMSTQYTLTEVDMNDDKLQQHQTLSAQHLNSPTVVIIPDASNDGSHQQLQQQQHQQQPATQKQQHLLQLPSLRIKSEELQRSVSQPLVSF